ncbi:cytochrome P450 [Dendrothele bispora CBS 962.96]|uniref:Cytochrome P450 n=1 Tax=Dendrothele bispora (strain CBS 962.96) TaxID=1314807 RepID=A0A4S8M8R9_DENBC|nr:cytochrome P450 [Dendrothele bispora CBS 962.96]
MSSDYSTLLLGAGFTALVLVYLSQQGKRKSPAPLPPGPKGLPLLGNVADLPQTQPWVTFAEFGRKYGGITYLTALGKHIIVLNDPKYATEMLDKKSRIYSDRPTLVMAGQLVGWDKGPALIPFSQQWSEYRRLFAQLMGTRSKIDDFNDLFHEETHTFLRNLLETPNSWLDHCRRYAGALVLRVAFGYKVKVKEDPLVKLVDEAMDNFSETTASNAFMVDVFPSLQYVPAWFPGAEWKRKATKYHKTLAEMLEVPFAWVKQQMVAGTADSCFVSKQLENKSMTPEEELTIKWTAGGIYSGGADTTVAHMECFFMAMALHVDAQQKAQAEMESVLGVGVLPTLADRGRLPYFEAMFTEVYRCYTLGPTGLPHVCTQDDVHDGYFIPKGSIIFTNVWQFLRDPKTYSDPDKFSPERFMESPSHEKEKDPKNYVFGFGRRACPGMHFADASLWILLASLVAGFDIRPPVKDGQTVLPSGKFADGSISHPEHFDCVITPRQGTLQSIIRS